ncbi:uncharacterized protein LOC123308225 isoform X2 [Coccinella septempunctata]|nr:uncharacterized protein LOC123308225 isoform X2 [Coccinella septempunctata]
MNSEACTLVHVPCASARSSCPSTVRYDRSDKGSVKKKNQPSSPLMHTDGEISPTPNTVSSRSAKPSLEEQEYLQFLLRITEDIIRNDLYSNKEMKKVFTSHVKANSSRLELDRMLLRIYELMKELNIPLGLETEENASASWTDIETAMRGLLCLENIKSQENQNKLEEDFKNKTLAKEKCICFDLRATYPVNVPNNDKKGDEDLKNEGYTPTDKFKISLDRLTEHTEPPSSRATCKISTSFSNFGDVDILPGFECLETPKVSKGVLCELYRKEKPLPRSIKTICHCHLAKKKPKIRKHKIKRHKKMKHKENIGQIEIGIPSTRDRRKYETENIQCEISTFKDNDKPIIISLHECKAEEPINKVESNDLDGRNPKNDYILIQGPIYLLKAFLEENPQLLMAKESPFVKKVVPPSEIPLKASETLKPTLENSGKMKEVEKESEDFVSTDEKLEPECFQEIQNILVELTKMSVTEIPSEDLGLDYLDMKDGCGKTEVPEGTEMNRLCKETCPHKSMCSKLRLATLHTMSPKEDNLWNDEYDLTPQKDCQEEPVVPTIIMQDFLTTREIQTEDIPHSPTVVGAALISYDDSSELEHPDAIEVDSQQSGPNKDVEPKLSEENKEDIQKTSPANDFFAFEKEITEPTNYNILSMATKHLDEGTDARNHLSDVKIPKIPVVNSYQTNDTLPTLASTATVERTKQFLEIEEELQRKNVNPLFSILNDYQNISNSKDDSGDIRHHRKVSILKNPIVQVPIDKMFTENDDSKKKGESIIRTVEILKDRQTVRDPYLDKVLQEIESSRESRTPEKLTSSEVSEKSDHLAMPGPSALKNTGKSPYYADALLDDNLDASYDELPIRISSQEQKDEIIGSVGQTSSSGVSSEAVSEQNFLSQLDEQAEIRGTPSQIRQIKTVTAKLEEFRHANDKDDKEISATLDKLVATLKEQQEKEEEVQVKIDERDDTTKPVTSNRKNSLRCCGLCKKKKAQPALPLIEPTQTNTFSEEDYKAKSEAFELALASLGQRQKPSEVEEQKEKLKKSSKGDEETKSSEYAGPSPIVHSGNRLSLVRIADERENDMAVLNADFEVISTKISNDRIKHI